MSIVHTHFWLISPTDAFKDIDYFPPIFFPFFLIFLSHAPAFALYVKCFVCLCSHSNSVKRDTWRGRRATVPFVLLIYSLLFRPPTSEVWSRLGVCTQELTKAPGFLWGAEGGVWGLEDGVGWGERGSSFPVIRVQTHSPVLLRSSHSPAELPSLLHSQYPKLTVWGCRQWQQKQRQTVQSHEKVHTNTQTHCSPTILVSALPLTSETWWSTLFAQLHSRLNKYCMDL